MRVLCKFLLKELLNQSDDEITTTFEGYGDNIQELYDGIIAAINNDPGIMRKLNMAPRE